MKTKSAPALSQDASDFLETLLWIAANPDDPRTRHVANWTIYEFHPEFVAALETFLSGFRAYLSVLDGPDYDVYADYRLCERSFGGNVFLSLSGHGAGFFDERDSELADALQAALEAYSGDKYRFETLADFLSKFNGKIHFSCRTAQYRREYLTKMFRDGVNFVTA